MAALNSEFSVGSDPSFLELVKCNGDEVDLLACARDRPLGLAKCPHSEDVGVICQGMDVMYECCSIQ